MSTVPWTPEQDAQLFRHFQRIGRFGGVDRPTDEIKALTSYLFNLSKHHLVTEDLLRFTEPSVLVALGALNLYGEGKLETPADRNSTILTNGHLLAICYTVHKVEVTPEVVTLTYSAREGAPRTTDFKNSPETVASIERVLQLLHLTFPPSPEPLRWTFEEDNQIVRRYLRSTPPGQYGGVCRPVEEIRDRIHSLYTQASRQVIMAATVSSKPRAALALAAESDLSVLAETPASIAARCHLLATCYSHIHQIDVTPGIVTITYSDSGTAPKITQLLNCPSTRDSVQAGIRLLQPRPARVPPSFLDYYLRDVQHYEKKLGDRFPAFRTTLKDVFYPDFKVFARVNLSKNQIKKIRRAIQKDSTESPYTINGPAMTLTIARFFGTLHARKTSYSLGYQYMQEAAVLDYLAESGHLKGLPILDRLAAS